MMSDVARADRPTYLVAATGFTLKSSIPFWPSLNSELQISFLIRSLASSETSYISSVGKSKQFCGYEKIGEDRRA